MLSSKFQLSGEGSAAAGPVGRHASAGTDWKMNTQMLTYSRSRGAFAGLTLEGAVVRQDDDSTRAVYGKKIPFRTVLSGKTATPEIAAEFMKAVSDASRQALLGYDQFKLYGRYRVWLIPASGRRISAPRLVDLIFSEEAR